MFTWLRKKWYARCRKIDIDILWKTCKKLAPDLDHAKAMFWLHAVHDEAWLVLGEKEIFRIVDELE